MEIGADVCWMLTVIVMQEDSVKYSKPINYWNSQLQTLCGFGSKKRLVTARSKAIGAGWLHYVQGDKRKPGIYWVTLPDGLSISDGGSCHESDLDFDGGAKRNGKPPMGGQNGTANSFGGNETERQRDPMRNGNSAPSVPNPIPTSPDSLSPDDQVSEKPQSKSKPKPACSAADIATAEYVWNAIKRLQPTRKPPNLTKWANDVRLMRERDNRDDAFIRRVFDAANRDEFWKTNILSTSKLREKYDDLSLKLDVKPKSEGFQYPIANPEAGQ